MNNDDSFNDSEELLNLYSSKKVTDIFKAQLKRIAANNQLTNTSLKANNVEDCQKTVEENTDDGVNPPEEQEEVEVVLVSKPNKTLEDAEVTPLDVEVYESLDDSIEVISEVTPRASRRSRRLRTRSRQSSCDLNQPFNNYSNTPVKKPTKGRKRSRKRNQKKGKAIEEITLDDSPQSIEPDDELNPEITVKVIWKSVDIKKYKMRKFQKLSYIFEQLSKEENIPEDKVMLTFKNVRVSHSDTPDSLDLQVFHFLDGGVLSELSSTGHTPKSHNSKCDNDSVNIKFQDVNKRVIQLSLNKKEKIKVGMIKCSEQLEIPLNKIKFYFDGELLEASETPETLGLENEEVIDIKIC